MDADGDVEQVDARIVETLKTIDERLRLGELAPATEPSTESSPAVSKALNCLQLLERVWPRQSAGLRRAGAVSESEFLGRFRIERVLGQGGFGIVYLATDSKLERAVALKVPRFHAMTDPRLRERFERESRAAAGLDHPHINPVYEAGEADGLCYIASAYCQGPNLSDWIRQEFPTGAPPQVAASLVWLLADAVAYSHAQGVLHRDIKPGNVLLVARRAQGSGRDGPELLGSLPVELPFTPRLTDFGLAKMMVDAATDPAMTSGETAASLALGTPAYMAPEQLQRSADRNAPAADIYALGAVFYETLTGCPPFQSASVADLLEQVRRSEPLPLRQLRRAIPRDLETICLKCLEKDPARRYATAGELRDDLARFLHGEPIRARPPGVFRRGMKAIRKRPIAATAGVASAIALLAFVGQRTWHAAQLTHINQTLRSTNADLESALSQSKELQLRLLDREGALLEQLHVNALRDAHQDIQHFRIERARRTLKTFIPPSSEQIDVRGVEWDYLWAEVQGPPPARVFSHDGIPVHCAAMSPDGRVAVTGDDRGWLKVWDMQTGGQRESWKAHDTRVVSLRFSGDGRYLATGGSYHWLHVWRTDTWELVTSIEAHDGTVQAVDFSADGEWIATGGRDGHVRIWEWRSVRQLREGSVTGDSENVIYQLRFSPEGDRLYSATRRGRVIEWATESMTPTESQFLPEAQSVHGADVSADGRLFVAGGDDIRFQRTHDGATVEYHVAGLLNSAAVSADGRRVCAGGVAGQIQIFDLPADQVTAVCERRWFGHALDVKGVALSGDGRWVLTASNDGTAKLWDLQRLPRIGRVLLGSPDVSLTHYDDVDVSADGRLLAASAHRAPASDGRLRAVILVYDLETMSTLHVLAREGCLQSTPRFSPDGKRLYVRWQADQGGPMQIASWELQSGASPQVEALADIEHFVVLPDGRRIIVAHGTSAEARVSVWNTHTQQIERELLPAGRAVLSLALSLNGERLAIVREEAPVALVDVPTGEIREIGGVDDATAAALDSRGESMAVVAIADVRIYDVASNTLIGSLPIQGYIPVPGRLSFSPQGNLLAISAADAAGADAPVLLWNVKSQRESYLLPTIGRHSWNLTWLPDGSGLAAATRPTFAADPAVLVWHLSDPNLSVRSQQTAELPP